MKLHEKKLQLEYAIVKAEGDKPFEIRKNDCDYQVGDLVHYTVVNDEGSGELSNFKKKLVDAYFDKAIYQITYITNYAQKDGYVVYGEKKLR